MPTITVVFVVMPPQRSRWMVAHTVDTVRLTCAGSFASSRTTPAVPTHPPTSPMNNKQPNSLKTVQTKKGRWVDGNQRTENSNRRVEKKQAEE